jgi:hypothetical protein
VVSWLFSHWSSGHEAELRRGLPRDLAREMEDVRYKGEEVEEVSIGLDGDWFLRTNARHCTSPSHGAHRSPSALGFKFF